MKIRQDRNKYNIGSNIRLVRQERGLTQEDTIARLQLKGIYMSRGTYSHIECGVANIRIEELLALSEVFHVEVAEFFKGIHLHRRDG